MNNGYRPRPNTYSHFDKNDPEFYLNRHSTFSYNSVERRNYLPARSSESKFALHQMLAYLRELLADRVIDFFLKGNVI